MKKSAFRIFIIVIISICLLVSWSRQLNITPSIKIKFNDTLYKGNVSGKLIFLFSKDTTEQLVYWVNPDKPHPVYTYDINNWNPKDTILINQFSDEWFTKFSELKGEYSCRVLFDINTEERSSFVAKENGYSKKYKYAFKIADEENLFFSIDNKFDGWLFNESDTIKELKLKSKLLTEFWGKDIFIKSAVVLPKGFDSKNENYQVVYVLPGFGSSHASVTNGTGQIDRYGMNKAGRDKIFVFMNGEFFQGYHHFADSENNGPWGKAFIEEFVPLVNETYGINADKSKNYLMGQSSGAWSAIWLLINYPDFFEHAFAASPDPIDFRAHAFDIYKDNSSYYYPKNADSIELVKGRKTRELANLEFVLGEFGQIRTWEATFSPKNENGEIMLLFDRESGNINSKVAEYWSNYDISKIINSDPNKYRQIISKKLHIFVSKDDPYDLNKSIELFEEMLKKNKVSADINYYNGLGHNVWTDELRLYIHVELNRPQSEAVN